MLLVCGWAGFARVAGGPAATDRETLTGGEVVDTEGEDERALMNATGRPMAAPPRP